MDTIKTWTITLVYDDLALEGLKYWARCDADWCEGVVIWTALHASAVDALDEVTRLFAATAWVARGEPEEAH